MLGLFVRVDDGSREHVHTSVVPNDRGKSHVTWSICPYSILFQGLEDGSVMIIGGNQYGGFVNSGACLGSFHVF